MSSTYSGSLRGDTQRSTDERTIDCETEIASLLTALEDEGCRAIIEATSEQPRSASELCDLCGLSSSTAYRKVDELHEAGLLTESVRLSGDGSHTNQYRLAVSDITISLDSDIQLSMSERGETISFTTTD